MPNDDDVDAVRQTMSGNRIHSYHCHINFENNDSDDGRQLLPSGLNIKTDPPTFVKISCC